MSDSEDIVDLNGSGKKVVCSSVSFSKVDFSSPRMYQLISSGHYRRVANGDIIPLYNLFVDCMCCHPAPLYEIEDVAWSDENVNFAPPVRTHSERRGLMRKKKASVAAGEKNDIIKKVSGALSPPREVSVHSPETVTPRINRPSISKYPTRTEEKMEEKPVEQYAIPEQSVNEQDGTQRTDIMTRKPTNGILSSKGSKEQVSSPEAPTGEPSEKLVVDVSDISGSIGLSADKAEMLLLCGYLSDNLQDLLNRPRHRSNSFNIDLTDRNGTDFTIPVTHKFVFPFDATAEAVRLTLVVVLGVQSTLPDGRQKFVWKLNDLGSVVLSLKDMANSQKQDYKTLNGTVATTFDRETTNISARCRLCAYPRKQGPTMPPNLLVAYSPPPPPPGLHLQDEMTHSCSRPLKYLSMDSSQEDFPNRSLTATSPFSICGHKSKEKYRTNFVKSYKDSLSSSMSVSTCASMVSEVSTEGGRWSQKDYGRNGWQRRLEDEVQKAINDNKYTTFCISQPVTKITRNTSGTRKHSHLLKAAETASQPAVGDKLRSITSEKVICMNRTKNFDLNAKYFYQFPKISRAGTVRISEGVYMDSSDLGNNPFNLNLTIRPYYAPVDVNENVYDNDRQVNQKDVVLRTSGVAMHSRSAEGNIHLRRKTIYKIGNKTGNSRRILECQDERLLSTENISKVIDKLKQTKRERSRKNHDRCNELKDLEVTDTRQVNKCAPIATSVIKGHANILSKKDLDIYNSASNFNALLRQNIQQKGARYQSKHNFNSPRTLNIDEQFIDKYRKYQYDCIESKLLQGRRCKYPVFNSEDSVSTYSPNNTERFLNENEGVHKPREILSKMRHDNYSAKFNMHGNQKRISNNLRPNSISYCDEKKENQGIDNSLNGIVNEIRNLTEEMRQNTLKINNALFNTSRKGERSVKNIPGKPPPKRQSTENSCSRNAKNIIIKPVAGAPNKRLMLKSTIRPDNKTCD